MDTYTIEPIVEPRNEDIVSLLCNIKAALLAVESAVREAKTPIPTVNLDDDGDGREPDAASLPTFSH